MAVRAKTDASGWIEATGQTAGRYCQTIVKHRQTIVKQSPGAEDKNRCRQAAGFSNRFSNRFPAEAIGQAAKIVKHRQTIVKQSPGDKDKPLQAGGGLPPSILPSILPSLPQPIPPSLPPSLPPSPSYKHKKRALNSLKALFVINSGGDLLSHEYPSQYHRRWRA